MAALQEQFEVHICSRAAARAAVEEQFAQTSKIDHAARRLLESLPVPAYLWEPLTASFLGSNAPFRQLTGYSEEEVLRLDWRNLIVPKDLNKSEQIIATRPEQDTDQRAWRTKSGKVVRVTRAARRLTFVDDKHRVRETYIGLVTQVEGQEKTCGSGLLP
jgi:PAS domain S-box-containing protein